MSTDQRQKVIKRFRSVNPVATVSVSTDQAPTACDNPSSSSNPLYSLGITDYAAEQIWTHATTLLADDSNFSVAPGSNKNAWMVFRSKDLRPHFVHKKKGHYECDQDCFYFQMCKVCAHIVSIADQNGDLPQFMEWLKKQNHAVNATAIAQAGLPLSSIGKKGGKKKGMSKKTSQKIKKMHENVEESSWKMREALRCQIPHSKSLSSSSSSSSSSRDQLSSVSTVQAAPQAANPTVMPTPSSGLATIQSCSTDTAALNYPLHPLLPSVPFPGFQQCPPTGTSRIDPFYLTFIRGNISVCFGCKQRYIQPILPPHNLCVMHREWRTFTLTGSPVPQSRFSNAYYHPHFACIKSIWPQFHPEHHLVITSDMKDSLTPQHKQIIYSSLGIVV